MPNYTVQIPGLFNWAFIRDKLHNQAYLQYSAVRSLSTVISKHFHSSKVKVYKHVFVYGPMRPKAREMAQYGGPPG